jgi:nucleotide-binding universal stress UspA family protein
MACDLLLDIQKDAAHPGAFSTPRTTSNTKCLHNQIPPNNGTRKEKLVVWSLCLMQLRRILCPVDFSACSLRAAEYAFELAFRFRASVEVVHVWQPVGGRFDLFGPPSAYAGEEAEVGRALERIKPRYTEVLCRHHLLLGDPADEIVQLTAEHQIDLIVIGTQGKTGLSRWILGSVAERVLRRATCPVLTCKQQPEKEHSPSIDVRMSFSTY